MEPDAKLAELLKQREALKLENEAGVEGTHKSNLRTHNRKRKPYWKSRSGLPKPAPRPYKGKRTPAARSLSGLWCSVMVDQKPESNANLLRDLDEFLERDRDRELFDLAPREEGK